MGRMRPGRRLAGVVAGLGIVAPMAEARPAELVVAIPEQSRETALIALARQAGLSLGFAPDAHCGGRAGVAGRMSLREALRRLLEGSACVAAQPDARTVVIRARPPPSPQAVAPPSPAALATLVGELVVTADKTETLLSAAPYGLTAASGAELQQAGVADVRDLSLLAAGVTVTNLGPGRDKMLLRGLSDGPLTGHTQSTVGLYLGDLRLTYNAPDPDLPLIDMARVEVLRGPQGSLYGAGSIGGILQLVPNPPDATARSGSVSARLADTAAGEDSHSFSGVLNQPISTRGAVRLAGWSETVGGYIDNPRQGRRDVDRSRRRGLRAAIRWRAGDDLTLDATAVVQSIATRDAHYADPAVGELARVTATPEPHDNDFLAAALSAHWTWSTTNLTASIGGLDHDVATTYDAAAAPLGLVAPGGHPQRFEDSNHIRGLLAETRLASSGAGRLRWTLGAFAALGQQKLDAAVTPAEPVAGYVEIRRDRLYESAMFGEVSYDLTSSLTATLGGRLFQSRLRTRSEIAVGAPVRTFADRADDSGIAPKALLAFRPRPGLTLYLQAAEGYRTAGFNTSGPPGQAFAAPGGEQPLRRYAGDELWNYEAGVRWSAPDHGLAARAAVFQADWKDIQADLVLPSGLPFTANLGDGRSRGVEVEARYTHRRLSIAGNLVRQEPELLRPETGLAARRDSGLPGVPNLSYAAVATYEAPVSADWTVELNASYAYVGRSRLTFDAETRPSMGGYGNLRFAATLRSDALSVGLFVDNALDRRGDTLAFGNPFSLRTTSQTTPQQPRTIGVRASHSF